ncbi:hypothetical protein NKI50_08525 [Mesorhizobium sp. M0563]
MCNLYNITTSQEAIRQWTRAFRDILGNLEPSIDIYPNQPGPVVRNAPDGEREFNSPLTFLFPFCSIWPETSGGIAHIASERFVTERFMPLARGASGTVLNNLHTVLKSAGDRDGRRYLLLDAPCSRKLSGAEMRGRRLRRLRFRQASGAAAWQATTRPTPPQCFLKYCTSRSCFSAASRLSNVPRLRRLPVFSSFLRE